jgi:SAM-dependent methyltransferase
MQRGSIPIPPRHFSVWPQAPGDRWQASELLDDPEAPAELITRGLLDLPKVNRWLGGWMVLRRELDDLSAELEDCERLRMVDLGTGAGDLAERAVQWSSKRGQQSLVLCMDRSRTALDVARQRLAQTPQLLWLRGGGRAIPLVDDSVEVAFCNNVLHHFDVGDATSVISEMARVARRAVIVTDLRRSWLSYWGARTVLRLLRVSPVTLHDGIVSVARSYTADELLDLGGQAGLRAVRVRRHLGHRISLRGVPNQ